MNGMVNQLSGLHQLVSKLLISYSGSNAPSIINKQNVLRQRGNDIYLSSVVEVKKDTPFNIYFEVSSPKSGSWLIYKHR